MASGADVLAVDGTPWLKTNNPFAPCFAVPGWEYIIAGLNPFAGKGLTV